MNSFLGLSFQEVSIVDASEDDQLAAAIQASLAESTKPSSHKYEEDSDSDIVSSVSSSTFSYAVTMKQ